MTPAVQMQFMRPAQLESAMRAFPVVYVPFGIIEWHSRHLPLGTDAINAHAVTVQTAEQHGGVVYPPIYFHCQYDRDEADGPDHLDCVLRALFERLRRTGFRVIIGVSGHGIDTGNGHPQMTMINNALEPVIRGESIPVFDRRLQTYLPDGGIAGIGLTENTLVRGHADAGVDHAGFWETCDMLYLCPDHVDMSELDRGREGIDTDRDPTEANAQWGEKKLQICADAIGRKARELLETLPPDKRGFDRELDGSSWWMI